MKNAILLILSFVLFTLTFQAKAENRIKVAVIDTGIYPHMEKMDFMCKNGVQDFTHTSPYDNHGHGSNIVGIIAEGMNSKTHCIISLKFYDKGQRSGQQMTQSMINAFRYTLLDTKIRYINISGGGPAPSDREKNIVKRILTRGIKLIAAAGNESSNLDTEKGKYYPASYRDELKYPNFYVVKSRHSSSNYGSIVTDTFSGINVKPKISGVQAMTGTSQATAQKTASLLKNVVLYKGSKNARKQTSNRRVRACR